MKNLCCFLYLGTVLSQEEDLLGDGLGWRRDDCGRPGHLVGDLLSVVVGRGGVLAVGGKVGGGDGHRHSGDVRGTGHGAAGRRVDPLLLLATVAEPDPHHLLLHGERFGEHGDLLGGGLRVLQEGLLQGQPDRGLDAGALLPPPPDGFWRSVGAGQRRVWVAE